MQKLSVLDEVSPEIIQDVIEPNQTENVFNLLELVFNGNTAKLKETLKVLEKTEDVYRLTSLLSSQTFQLAAVMSAGPDDNPATDFGIHPFVLSKLKTLYKKIGKNGVVRLVNEMAQLDENLKTTGIDPWLLVEQTLMKLSATAA